MVSEVVHHRHASGDAPNFHAALDSFEGLESRLNLVILQTAMFCAGHDGQGIAHVQFTHKIRVKLEAGDLKLRGCGTISQVESLNGVAIRETKAFDRTVSHIQQRGEVGIVTVTQEQPVARDEADKMLKRGFNGIEGWKDIGVIKLQVVD